MEFLNRILRRDLSSMDIIAASEAVGTGSIPVGRKLTKITRSQKRAGFFLYFYDVFFWQF